MAAILSRPQCVKFSKLSRGSFGMDVTNLGGFLLIASLLQESKDLQK